MEDTTSDPLTKKEVESIKKIFAIGYEVVLSYPAFNFCAERLGSYQGLWHNINVPNHCCGYTRNRSKESYYWLPNNVLRDPKQALPITEALRYLELEVFH
jgi:hypothetical protein